MKNDMKENSGRRNKVKHSNHFGIYKVSVVINKVTKIMDIICSVPRNKLSENMLEKGENNRKLCKTYWATGNKC